MSRFSPETVTEPFVTSSTVTPGNSAKAALILPPQPLGHFMPVTSKLTVVEASCVSVSGSTVDVAAGSELLTLLSESVAGAVLGCCVQPIANSINDAARSLSFIGPLSKKRSVANHWRLESSSVSAMQLSVHRPNTTSDREMQEFAPRKLPKPGRKSGESGDGP